MSRKLFILSTLLFWLTVIGLAITAASWPVKEVDSVPDTVPVSASASVGTISLAELSQHATPEDCWMAIRGSIYDLSSYLPEHPSRPSIVLPWCGKEATEAYETKMKGRQHSNSANELLEKYRLGTAR